MDTGASCSILPHRATTRPSGPRLIGADGTEIPAWGSRQLTVCFGGRDFSFTFLLAAVSRPILGNDFLAAHNLLVDPAKKRVLDATSLQPIGGGSQSSPSRLVAALQPVAAEVRQLLASFPQVVNRVGIAPPKALHGVEHHIETTGRPVFAKARRLDPARLRIAKEEFSKMEAAGIIRRSDSPWASPLHMVPKKDGGWRPCGDYRRLNIATVHDRYPLPNIHDSSHRLHGCKVFSKIDLVKGYFQVPVAKADIPKTAIITPFGLFEFLAMPFGLKNAAQTFQRLMDRLFGDLGFCFVYLDDIIVASPDMATHLQHLRQVFTVLQDNGLVINMDKCVFAQSAVDFLGHRVSASSLTPLPGHVDAIRQYPEPQDVKQLQRFLGMVNFYRRFLPGAAGMLRPLTDALAGSSKSLQWSPVMRQAFEDIKAALAGATPLVHPDPAARISLATDASQTHVGGVLQQWQTSGWAPLAFFSAKLNSAQMKYSTFDRELLAAFLAVRHFRFYLEGREFVLFTDHKPLVAAFSRVSPPWTARQQRQLAYLAEFGVQFSHMPGADNVVADALSRPPSSLHFPCTVEEDLTHAVELAPSSPSSLPASTPVVSFLDMAVRQIVCHEVSKLKCSPSLQITSVPVGDVFLFGDVSTGVFRPLVPVVLRHAIFSSIHSISHPGIRATRRLVSSRFVWAGLANDVERWTRECLACQRAKVSRHTRLAAEPIPVPARRFSHIHVDLVGPLPPSRGFTHLFTVIDRSTRWFEALPLASTTAADCAAALFAGWIARFGVPAQLTSDRGAQFTSAVWRSLCQLLHIQHIETTAYHPQSNGMVERQHRRLKDSLRARCTSAAWVDELPWVLLGMRSAPREDDSLSPAEAVYGSPLVLPGQFLPVEEPPPSSFFPLLRLAMSGFEPAPASAHTSSSRPLPMQLPPDLMQAECVLVRRDAQAGPLAPAYDGPYRVLLRSPHFFKLQIGNRQDSVSVHRLKAAYMPANAVPALPPRRGRPPKVVTLPPVRRQVRFQLPPVTAAVPAPPVAPVRTSSRPARAVRPPDRLAL